MPIHVCTHVCTHVYTHVYAHAYTYTTSIPKLNCLEGLSRRMSQEMVKILRRCVPCAEELSDDVLFASNQGDMEDDGTPLRDSS